MHIMVSTEPRHRRRRLLNNLCRLLLLGSLSAVNALATQQPPRLKYFVAHDNRDPSPQPQRYIPPMKDLTVGDCIPDHYIVSLVDGRPDEDVERHHLRLESWLRRYHATIDETYHGVTGRFDCNVWCGYSMHISKEFLPRVLKDPLVEYIEPDCVVGHHGMHLDASYSTFANLASPDGMTSNKRLDPMVAAAGPVAPFASTGPIVDQFNPPWGLDRIGHQGADAVNLFRHGGDAGEDVDIYVVDTGIRTTHVEFDGARATFGADFTNAPPGTEDDNGHGTNVAGIAAGRTYGVAKKANVIAVKVLGRDGTGPTQSVLQGLQWVVQRVRATGRSPAVANLSLGGGGLSPALNDLVQQLVMDGVAVTVAAGNLNEDACKNSPADSGLVLTVAAMDVNDVRANFSNWGPCVSLFAPGKAITSAWYSSDNAVQAESGTSQAAPHVAGVLATIFHLDPTIDVLSAYQLVLTTASKVTFRGNAVGSDPNLMLNSAVENGTNIDGIVGTGTSWTLFTELLSTAWD